MKKNTESKKPFSLNPETVRHMTLESLETVAGGAISQRTNSCVICGSYTRYC